MVYTLIRHNVEDFGKWKGLFDEHDSVRKEAGEESYQLFQSAGKPNEVTVLFNWESKEKAEAFLNSDELKDKMKEAGVLDAPEVTFLEEAN